MFCSMTKNFPAAFWTFLCFLLASFTTYLAFIGVWSRDAHYQLLYGNLFGSFLIGLIGALCYCWGIQYGFIERASKTTPSYMKSAMDMLLFCSLGGLVALVFQSPQAETLTPIQAFVLGATWPSVVNRVIAGNSQPPGSEAKKYVSSNNPPEIPTPTGQPGQPPANIEHVLPPASADA
jgi:hypothetical protein